ncbi:MAG: indole-3-glycerol phosphate synthase TrpC [Parvularculaceae bacterium]
MTDILCEIIEYKKREIAAGKSASSFAALEAAARAAPAPRDFEGALRAKIGEFGVALIAEIKKASPSKGLIRNDFSPPDLAQAYARGGAACLSVLTDTPSFMGAPEHLQSVRAAVDLPVLRKDFMIDPWQIAQSRALGADGVLLIMACLEDAQAAELYDAAQKFGMAALFETHDRVELDRAIALGGRLIGVNNRNLSTFETDLATTETLAPHIPSDRLLIAESGIGAAADIARLARAGARAFLVGESLMRADDVAAATAELLAPEAQG